MFLLFLLGFKLFLHCSLKNGLPNPFSQQKHTHYARYIGKVSDIQTGRRIIANPQEAYK